MLNRTKLQIRNRRVSRRDWIRQRGLSTIELTVACTLLSALFGIGGALFVRVYRIGQDAEYRSIALQEVANELETKLLQTAEQRASTTEQRPSEAVLYRWPDAKLLFRETRDELGIRVTVELVLHSDPLAKTIQLSGWIVDDQSSTRSEP
ncbi:MAG: hypothetical protein MUC43_08410 [Pirellula sp.]|jgi:hypothetical protein|nr:hypothetical protein [Pirellula sp.]